MYLLLDTVKIVQSTTNFDHNNKKNCSCVIMHLKSISTSKGHRIVKLLTQTLSIVYKLLQTGNIVRLAQRMFGFAYSFLIEKRSNKFYMVKWLYYQSVLSVI